MAEPITFRSPLIINMKGTRKLRAELERIARLTPEKAKAALYQEGKRQMMMAFRKTPVDPMFGGGSLRDSAEIELPYRRGDDLIVPFGFGTTPETAKYAVVQHQKHFKHSHGQRRFLADVVYKNRGRMVRRMAKALRIV